MKREVIEDQLWVNQLAGLKEGCDLEEFQTRVSALGKRVDQLPLPAIDIAMWMSDIDQPHALGDPSALNDRFLEQSPELYGRGHHLQTLLAGLHNLCLLLFAAMVVDSGLDWIVIGGYLMLATVIGSLLAMVVNSGTHVRFNRQAQLVHVEWDKGKVIHLPWRRVFPMLELGAWPSSQLKLYFPRPRILTEVWAHRGFKLDHAVNKYPFEVRGALDYYDYDSSYRILQRLDFLRRYMEGGMQAIQPTGEGPHPPFANRADDATGMGIMMKYIFKPLSVAWYWFACGPLIDRWVQRKVDAFRWPEEVERLCAVGADLSVLDTRPVKARTDLFYRPDLKTEGLYFVDASGNPVRVENSRITAA